MSSKYPFLLIIALTFIIGVSSLEIIEKYGKKETLNKYVFLETKDFDNGDKIHISITGHNGYDTSRISYKFFESIDHITDASIGSIEMTSTVEKSSSSSEDTNEGYYIETFDYKIKKNDKQGNYLLLKFEFNPPVTVENTKESNTVIIIVCVVVSVVIIIVVVVILIWHCRRCKNAQTYVDDGYPVNNGYVAKPSGSQPDFKPVQPVMNAQPYDANSPPNQNYNPNGQYNQDAPIQQGSDNRIN